MGTESREQESVGIRNSLELVVISVETWDLGLETFACPDSEDETLELGALLGRGAGHQLPVIEHTLGEGLSLGVRP